MSLTSARERAPQKALVDVRIVDSDVHPVPRPGEMTEYIPEPWRTRYARRRVGETITYDAPDYAHAQAMRLDSFPDDGNFPGSDPELAFRQVIMQAGSDICILEPGARSMIVPEFTQAMATATNHWLANHWLDATTNWHERWRGSICVAIEDPAGAVKEIEYWAGHPYMSQVLIHAEPRPAWGDPKYDPIWQAAVRASLPVACHLGRGYFELLPTPPVGHPSYNHDFMVTYSLLAVNQVMSLVFDGVFERFPDLQIVLVEHANSWIMPLMWRMDTIYAEQRANLPQLKRKPSEYVYDHIWLTTQPLDFPEDRGELGKLMEWMEADRLLLFSSDYPHWTFDDPKWLIRQIPAQLRDRIMFQNGIDVYHLPSQVPALEGQTRVH